MTSVHSFTSKTVCAYVFVFLSAKFKPAHGGITNPDYESDWMPIKACHPVFSTLEVDHGLGEVPLLVDVQVKSLFDPNKDFIFPGVGSASRDDDDVIQYGGVVYVYNNKSVKLSAPTELNTHGGCGKVIYTGDGTYYTDHNQQESVTALVRVRAWLASSLPPPDFNKTGLGIKAGSQNVSEVYIEESHGLGEYPILAKVRTRLIDGGLSDWYSDGVGSSVVITPLSANRTTGRVVFGYNNDTIRVWASSSQYGRLFHGLDGYGLAASASTGEVQMVAWTRGTMHWTFKLTVPIGPWYINEHTDFSYGYEFSDDMYMVSLVEATSGPNLGYRFQGGGALAYTTHEYDPVCTYGGYVYAYNTKSVRFWRPEPVLNSGLVCISSYYGNGTNVQSDPRGTTVTFLWASSYQKVKPPLELKVFNWTPVEPNCIQRDL